MSTSRSATAAICSAKSSSLIGSQLRLMRSLSRSRCGLVYVPTVSPCAISRRVIICVVEPLPLVPVTWMTGYVSCGSPIAATSALHPLERGRRDAAGGVVVGVRRRGTRARRRSPSRRRHGAAGLAARPLGDRLARHQRGVHLGAHGVGVDDDAARRRCDRAARTSCSAAPLRGWRAGREHRCRAAAPGRRWPRAPRG